MPSDMLLIALEIIAGLFFDAAALIGIAVAACLSIVIALLGISYAWEAIGRWIYNGGMGQNLRYLGKSPWKGYHRFRSFRWNVQHTS